MYFFISFFKEKGYNNLVRKKLIKEIDGGNRYEGACKYTDW